MCQLITTPSRDFSRPLGDVKPQQTCNTLQTTDLNGVPVLSAHPVILLHPQVENPGKKPDAEPQWIARLYMRTLARLYTDYTKGLPLCSLSTAGLSKFV